MTQEQERYVYKRKDGRWEARFIKGYSESGKPVFGAVYAKTRAEAVAKRTAVTGGPKETAVNHSQLNLLILGAGSHGSDIKEIAENMHIFKHIRFLDDNIERDDVIGKCSEALKFRSEYPCAFIAIGDNKVRRKYAKFLRNKNFLMPNIISPMASLSSQADLGEGIAILPQSTVGAAKVGDFVIITPNSLVNSESEIGSFTRIDNGAIVLKGKRVPECTWIKTGEIYGK